MERQNWQRFAAFAVLAIISAPGVRPPLTPHNKRPDGGAGTRMSLLTAKVSADGLESPEGPPPRDWPVDTRKNLLDILRDDHASETDLFPAAELAGDSSIRFARERRSP